MVSSFGHNTTLCYIINQDQHGRTNINYSTARNAGSTYFPGIQDIHSTNHWLRGLKEKHEGLLSGICCKKPPSVFCLRTRECRTLTLGRGTSSSFCRASNNITLMEQKHCPVVHPITDRLSVCWRILSNKGGGQITWYWWRGAFTHRGLQ